MQEDEIHYLLLLVTEREDFLKTASTAIQEVVGHYMDSLSEFA